MLSANFNANAGPPGKKGSQVQLQAEVQSDDEWTKLVMKPGLLVVDIYSEWCGPCIGMLGNLKKLKLEVGGDNLQLAVAKSDSIECLKRFRNKSEPIWMFVAGGHVVNLMFGADAPRLTALIVRELDQEAAAGRGERERARFAFDELTPEEQVRATADAEQRAAAAARSAAAARAAQAARRAARSAQLAPYVRDTAVMLVWPHAVKQTKRVAELIEPLGLVIADKYPTMVSSENLALLLEDVDLPLEQSAIRAIAERPGMAVLIKKPPDREGDIFEFLKDALLEDKTRSETTQTDAANSDTEVRPATGTSLEAELTLDGVPGFYCTTDENARTAAVDVLYSKLVSQHVEPARPPTPPHVAAVFGACWRRDVLATDARRAGDVLAVGFFADDDLSAPRCIAVTPEQYEERPQKDYAETIILKVANRETALREIADLGPSYVSPDTELGGLQCARLFPRGYGAPPPSKQMKAKKKKTKKRDATKQNSRERSESVAGTAPENTAEGNEVPEAIASVEGTEERGESEGEEEATEVDEVCEADDMNAEDKATSPMPDAS